jgi:hypothetical protein
MASATNAQHKLGIRPFSVGLSADADESRIFVRTSRGGFRVIYKRPLAFPQLVLDLEVTGGMKNSSGLGHIRKRAWRLANDLATNLGWFGT